MTLSLSRRCCLAISSLALAWILLHPYVADALCMRGDEYVRIGDALTAQRYYTRAVAVDPDSPSAVERFAFSALELRTRNELTADVNVTTAFLKRHPEDFRIRLARALAFSAIGLSAEAAADFRAVGAARRDLRYIKLADRLERRKGTPRT